MKYDENFYQNILNNSLDAIWVIDENENIVYMNHAAENLSGYKFEELNNKPLSTIIPKSYSIDHKQLVKNYINQGPQGKSEVLNKIREFYIINKEKIAIPIELVAFEINNQNNGQRFFAGIMRDIRSRKILEENQKLAIKTLKKLAYLDELTMIPNRRSFYSSFKKLLASIQRHERSAIAAVVDIDHFKEINDTYGHDVGDMVLRTVSNIFVENLREEDVVGRIGGEEFGFLFPDTNEEGAKIVLDRLRLAVRNHRFFVYENFYLNVTISGGFSKIHPDQTIEEVIKCADIALYKAKNLGRDAIEFFPA